MKGEKQKKRPTKACIQVHNEAVRGIILSLLSTLIAFINAKSSIISFFTQERLGKRERGQLKTFLHELSNAIAQMSPDPSVTNVKSRTMSANFKKLIEKSRKVEPALISTKIGGITVSVEQIDTSKHTSEQRAFYDECYERWITTEFGSDCLVRDLEASEGDLLFSSEQRLRRSYECYMRDLFRQGANK